jgi:hypothetical protein
MQRQWIGYLYGSYKKDRWYITVHTNKCFRPYRTHSLMSSNKASKALSTFSWWSGWPRLLTEGLYILGIYDFDGYNINARQHHYSSTSWSWNETRNVLVVIECDWVGGSTKFDLFVALIRGNCNNTKEDIKHLVAHSGDSVCMLITSRRRIGTKIVESIWRPTWILCQYHHVTKKFFTPHTYVLRHCLLTHSLEVGVWPHAMPIIICYLS